MRGHHHLDMFPDVVVQVLESVSLHKSVASRFTVCRSARGNGFANNFINAVSALTGTTDRKFGAFRGITDLFERESL
jgi:hypothetical protein